MRSCVLLLDDAFLGLQHEVAVVLPGVREVHHGGGEGPEGLGVLLPQLLGHVETVHQLALPPLRSLGDAVQELHLRRHTCTFSFTRNDAADDASERELTPGAKCRAG